MLQINGLNLTHKKDLRIILGKFDLVLNYGDKAAIIGGPLYGTIIGGIVVLVIGLVLIFTKKK